MQTQHEQLPTPNVEAMKVHLGHLLFEREWRKEHRVNFGVSLSDHRLEEDIEILDSAIRFCVTSLKDHP